MPAVTPLHDHVRALLASHLPGAEERQGVDRMWALLEEAGPAFDPDHYHPGHFTASGVVSTPAFAEIVLIDHAKIGKWLQPGGHFEPWDRSPVDAARREITEECGLSRLEPLGLIDVDVHDIAARGDQPAHAHFDLRFLFTTTERRLRTLDGVLGAKWVGVDEDVERLGLTVQRLLDKVGALPAAR